MREIEICFDEIEGLGTYVEAEKLITDDQDANAAVDELWRFFDLLGIKREDEETRGYDVIMKHLAKT